MATPFFETLALTSFVKRVHGADDCMVTLEALLKALTLGRKDLAKQIGKTLLPITLFVHPDKVPKDDKGIAQALFSSMRNPATGAIFKEVRAVRAAEPWYRNAWVTAVVNSMGIPHESVAHTLNTPEQQTEALKQIREEREDDAEIADAAALLQSKLQTKYAKKQATGNMCTDSQAIVIWTDTFLTKSIDKLRVGGATKADRAAIHRDMFEAVAHINAELNTPTRTQPVNTSEAYDGNDTESEDEDAPMDISPASAPAAPLKRARDVSDSDISVASSPTKLRRNQGQGIPITEFAHLTPILNVAHYWADVLKPENPARKCKAGTASSKTYFNTLSKVFQRNFTTKDSLTQDAIESLTKEKILTDTACFPSSKPTEKNPTPSQDAQKRRLCAWGRFQTFVASLDEEDFDALLTNLPTTSRKIKDVRSLGMNVQ